MRRKAKVINFGILYGMGINALRGNLGTTRDEAKIFYDQYFKNFSGLSAYLENTKLDAAKNGYTETFFGRRRYFPGIKSKLPFIRASAERMAINAPLQGTCADILKLAMVRVNDYLTRESISDKVFLILTVHDELVYEVADDVAAKVLPKIKEIMENIVSPEDWKGLPLVVNSSVGKNWGEMK
jgi:DNA polymerase-1